MFKSTYAVSALNSRGERKDYKGVLCRFPSVIAQYQWVMASGASCPENRHWTGESLAELKQHCREGLESWVPNIEALVSDFENAVDLPTSGKAWTHGVAGCFPDVPAFLAGDAECMWDFAEVEGQTQPVRVFACVTSSADLSASKLRKRGAGIAALVSMLSRYRPVELYTVGVLGGSASRKDAIVTVRHESHPMVLAEVTYGLCSSARDRYLNHTVARAVTDFIGYWPSFFPFGVICDEAVSVLTQILDLTEQDVLIGPATSLDPVTVDPLGFVRSELKRQGILAA